MIANLISTFEQVKQDLGTIPLRIEALYTDEPMDGSSHTFVTSYFTAAAINMSVFPTGNYLLETIITGKLHDTNGSEISINVTLFAETSGGSNLIPSGVTLTTPNLIRARTQGAVGTAASASELVNTLAPYVSSPVASSILYSSTGHATYGYAISKTRLSVTGSTFNKFKLRLSGFSHYNSIYFKLTKIS